MTRRSTIIGALVVVAIGLWLTAVFNATRDNLRVDLPAIYAQLGGTGDAGECPNVTSPPGRETLLAARDLRDLTRRDPAMVVPNPNPEFGTLTASNVKTLVAGNVQACVLADPNADPRWDRIARLLR